MTRLITWLFASVNPDGGSLTLTTFTVMDL